MIRILIIFFLVCASISLRAQTIITTIAGKGTQGFSGDGGPATNAEFNHANLIWLYKEQLYIADALNHRIRKMNLVTGIINTVAGTGTPGYNGDNILATDAHLQVSEGVCLDSIGNIYIADAANHRIRKVNAYTGVITTIAGTGVSGNFGDGGLATNAKLAVPLGMWVDKRHNLYFCDGINHNIRKINPTGIISTVGGNGIPGYSGDNGLATNAQLNRPGLLVTDNHDNIFFTDGSNHALRKINAGTGIITTIAGNGTAGYFGDGGPASNARLNYPAGIAMDKDGNIFVAEAYNDVIRKIDASTGIITTVVGCGIFGFSGDGGPPILAELNYPNGIFLDSFGTMYIADYKFNNRIRKVYNPQLSVNTPSINNKASVYPNPANNEITIEYSFGNNENAMLQITDIAGRVIASKTLLTNIGKEILNIHNFSPGLYLYKIIQSDLPISTGKIIKQ